MTRSLAENFVVRYSGHRRECACFDSLTGGSDDLMNQPTPVLQFNLTALPISFVYPMYVLLWAHDTMVISMIPNTPMRAVTTKTMPAESRTETRNLLPCPYG